jgi:RasGEF domain/RasGEF N-terminal motif
MVKIAKQLQESLRTEVGTHTVYELLDELVLKAFKVVIRAVRFLDIWSQDVGETSSGTSLFSEPQNRPLTPPVDQNFEDREPSRIDSPAETARPQEEGVVLPTDPVARSDQPGTRGRTPRSRAWTAASPFAPVQLASSAQGTSQSSKLVSRSLSLQTKRLSVSHRLSYVGKAGGVDRENLASERLNAAHDSFLSLLGTFIGLHLQSRSAQELTFTTQQSVTACRLLLAVVDEVWARDGRRSEFLHQARDVMYTKLAELVQATKDMFTTLASEEDVLNPDQGRHLVATTTNCIRAAGDCVSKTRLVIERIGDFEFETTSGGLSDVVFATLKEKEEEPTESGADSTSPTDLTPTPDTSGSTRLSSDSESSHGYQKLLPVPPEPTARPPPPPLVLPNSKPLPDTPTAPSQIPQYEPTLKVMIVESPDAMSNRSSQSSVPPLSQSSVPQLPEVEISPLSPINTADLASSPFYFRQTRTDSVNASVADTNSTWRNSMPQDNASTISLVSTRATTPDKSPIARDVDPSMLGSFGSISEVQAMVGEDSVVEEQVMEKTFAHELIYNKEGQITGGSLPALVERLTTHDTTPDSTFLTTFYLTFRLFTTPCDFAQSLVDRFDYIGDSQHVGVPVRLRVYNIFKGWLESHWQGDADSPALGIVVDFATGPLGTAIPAAGKRLHELAAKVSDLRAGALVPRLVSSLGKTSTSVTVFSAADSQIPSPNVTKSQLSALRASRTGGPLCSILDFDPLELARQFTIIESRIFCSIFPEELLALEWTKKVDSRAINVKAMSTLSTDLANLVADTILSLEEPKKRALIIKQWVKIAMKCLELNNYDSLMAIICSLNSSMVLRLKKTWELVSQKTKARLEELKSVVDVGRNYAVLRHRLQNHVAPCIPFVGLYLTDLTFVDVGNQSSRLLPGTGEGSANGKSVINFDKHMKTAKIIGQLQRFQVPYRLAAVPEMQDWMEAQIQRVRNSDTSNVQSYYRRSLALEPRQTQQSLKPSDADSDHKSKVSVGGMSAKERFDLWGTLHIGSKEKNIS